MPPLHHYNRYIELESLNQPLASFLHTYFLHPVRSASKHTEIVFPSQCPNTHALVHNEVRAKFHNHGMLHLLTTYLTFRFGDLWCHNRLSKFKYASKRLEDINQFISPRKIPVQSD